MKSEETKVSENVEEENLVKMKKKQEKIEKRKWRVKQNDEGNLVKNEEREEGVKIEWSLKRMKESEK